MKGITASSYDATSMVGGKGIFEIDEIDSSKKGNLVKKEIRRIECSSTVMFAIRVDLPTQEPR